MVLAFLISLNRPHDYRCVNYSAQCEVQPIVTKNHFSSSQKIFTNGANLNGNQESSKVREKVKDAIIQFGFFGKHVKSQDFGTFINSLR